MDDRSSWMLLSLAFCAGCMSGPRNGTVLDQTTVPFDGATLYAADTMKLQVQDQTNTSVWADVGSTASGTSPVTDNAGTSWYLYSHAGLPLPLGSVAKAKYWRKAASSGSQRRISADFRGWSTKLNGAVASFDTNADACGNANVDAGLFAVIQNCSSSRSPEAEVFLSCGKAGQACCNSYQIPATQLCDASLACSADLRCVNPSTEKTRWFASYQTCRPSDPDCNVCAPNVRQQLDQAAGADQWFDTGDSGELMHWDDAQWNFNWEKNYPPSNREPDNVFGEHVQGFVRTNRDPFRFAGSYSANDGTNGGMFIIQRDSDGKKRLVNLFTARHRHPGGGQAIGKYYALSDYDDEVRLIDIERHAENHLLRFPVPGIARAGGGMGIVKLKGSGYLLVVSPKGDDEGSDRDVRFFQLQGNLESPSVTPVGRWAYKQPSSWSGDYRYTENLSVIPECGTGDIYVLNTTGSNVSVGGRGYWLLSKVVQDPAQGGVSLAPQKAYFQDEVQSRCHHRASATAWVNPSGKIELMCSERAAVNGIFDGNEDTVRFSYGAW